MAKKANTEERLFEILSTKSWLNWVEIKSKIMGI
jgi:hypothetical protein